MDTFGTHRSGFRDIGVADWLCRHISCVGLSRPTEVQKYCIPPILEGELFDNVKSKEEYPVGVTDTRPCARKSFVT